MGRTLPSITQVFLQEQQSFARFRRALRRSDQHALTTCSMPPHVWRFEPQTVFRATAV
jgi:hypothetical protein